MKHPLHTTLVTLREHGLRSALRLWRYYAYCVLARFSRMEVECPVCGWVGRSFRPFLLQPCWVRRSAICPGCGALERHRFLFLFYRSYVERHDLAGRRCLHFAPEECLCRLFESSGVEYRRSEYGGPGVGDMQSIDSADGSFDWVIAHHVMEHVEDDGRALREVRRVMASGGVFHLDVPVSWRLPSTRSLGAPSPENHGHWREYGADVGSRFDGFAWERIQPSSMLSAAEIRRFGVDPGEPFFELRKPLD